VHAVDVEPFGAPDETVALKDLADHARELFSITCRFKVDGEIPPLEPHTVGELYKIAQEAVTNAIKHGKAKNILITLEPSGDRFLLSVKDDGIGFLQNDGKLTGMGIRIMQYRARVIGASLTLQSRPGSGTDIACLFVPISGEWRHNNETRANHEPNGVSTPQTS